jgi:hypothetical protein
MGEMTNVDRLANMSDPNDSIMTSPICICRRDYVSVPATSFVPSGNTLE